MNEKNSQKESISSYHVKRQVLAFPKKLTIQKVNQWEKQLLKYSIIQMFSLNNIFFQEFLVFVTYNKTRQLRPVKLKKQLFPFVKIIDKSLQKIEKTVQASYTYLINKLKGIQIFQKMPDKKFQLKEQEQLKKTKEQITKILFRNSAQIVKLFKQKKQGYLSQNSCTELPNNQILYLNQKIFLQLTRYKQKLKQFVGQDKNKQLLNKKNVSLLIDRAKAFKQELFGNDQIFHDGQIQCPNKQLQFQYRKIVETIVNKVQQGMERILKYYNTLTKNKTCKQLTKKANQALKKQTQFKQNFIQNLDIQYLISSKCINCVQAFIQGFQFNSQLSTVNNNYIIAGAVNDMKNIQNNNLILSAISSILNSQKGIILFDCLPTTFGFQVAGQKLSLRQQQSKKAIFMNHINSIGTPRQKNDIKIQINFIPIIKSPLKEKGQIQQSMYSQKYVKRSYCQGQVMRVKIISKKKQNVYYCQIDKKPYFYQLNQHIPRLLSDRQVYGQIKRKKLQSLQFRNENQRINLMNDYEKNIYQKTIKGRKNVVNEFHGQKCTDPKTITKYV